MDAYSESPSTADLAGRVGALNVGLGTLTFQLFPFALPAIILVVGPLAVLAVAGLLLVLPILVPLWLGRLGLRALRGRSRPQPAPPPSQRPAGSLRSPVPR
jgi:hypothetical protein